jgi:hypothetical protein
MQHSLLGMVDKIMNMCESYLTKTYLKNSRASSFRCIGIAECLPYRVVYCVVTRVVYCDVMTVSCRHDVSCRDGTLRHDTLGST